MAKPGLPAKYAKMGFKKGWAAYKKAQGGRRAAAKRGYQRVRAARAAQKARRRSTRRPSRRSRARATVARRTSGMNSQKVMKYVRLAALLGPAATYAMTNKDPATKVREIIQVYTGYNMTAGQFNWADLARGWTPYLASVLATYGIPKLAGMIRKA